MPSRLIGTFGFIGAIVLSAILALPAGAEELQFPLRGKYPETTPISIEDFAKLGKDVIVIDARNSVEFDVIHIDGAHNLPAGKMKEKDLLKLRGHEGEPAIVFYCNGLTCSKSYKGTKKAVLWGFKNVFVYDAGIFNWAKAHPTTTLFFNEPLTAETLKTKLISKEAFGAVKLAPEEFVTKAKSGDYRVFDVRDRDERSKFRVKLPGLVKTDMTKFVGLLDTGAVPESNILVIDRVGKQVKWLQYYLKQTGRTDYFFIEGGAAGWKDAGFDGKGNRATSARAK